MAVAFDINSFRSKFEQYGGGARLSLFTVEIYRPDKKSNMMPTRDLLFFCKSVNFPGINLETAENKPYGIGNPVRHPIGMSSQDVNAIFMLDSNHAVLSFFHSWMQDVYNYQASNLGAANQYYPNQAVYEIGYMSDYACNISIKYYSTHDTKGYYECFLEGAYPTQVGQVDLAMESNDQVATLPINFAYERISYTANRSGPVQGMLSRSTGLLDYIASIGQIGQTVQSIRKPQSVQDAVNMFTNVAYTWDNIRNMF